MKVIVLGNNHAGTAAVTHILKENPGTKVVSYDRNDNISFLACGIALWVSNTIKKPDGLFYSSPEKLAALGAEVHMRHEVLSIDFKAKEVNIKNLETGDTFTDSYDKLVMATGSWPIKPPIPGIDNDGIKFSKLFQHAENIIETIKSDRVKNITVVGAGYIGIELVEAFYKHGKNVTLVEAQDRILCNYFDNEFTEKPTKSLEDKGIAVKTQEKVMEFIGENGHVTKVVTDKGVYPADMVIMSVGFKPVTDFAKGHLEMLPNGAIKVDEYMYTSDPDVLAIGDCASIYSNAINDTAYIALATNAVRMGILAGKNIINKSIKHPGTQGSNAISIFEYKMASTGLSETAAKARGLNVKTNTVTDTNRPEFMPTYDDVQIKVVYDSETRRLLGAQILSTGDYTQCIHTLSLAIQQQLTVDQFALTDFFFLPHFNKPVSYLTSVALDAK
ncbi:NADH oxidase [Thiospirochaeta perfilievii]|uniref:NADH oxidase n=1 Tax=Thiospirochaeta perfilievii TaxID=252967 RepID=A0A5C1QF83_9SPIO|nr:FAD-dependent oxidoreductase [Thiospirochaeta perfilievii]QEN06181.1 NADH oxidase [Thiospirochaeta perfilievii]